MALTKTKIAAKDKSEMETKSVQFEIKEANEDGSFTGILSVYDVVDDGGDLCEAGCFTKTLKESGGRIPCLYRHSEPIGTLDVTDTGKALEVKGQLILDLNPDGSPAVPEAFKALALMRKKILKGLSIGFITIKSAIQDGVRRLKELALKEGSVVVFPMLQAAQITSVKENHTMERKTSFDDALEALTILRALWDCQEALSRALSSLFYDSNLSADDCAAQVAQSIDQFGEKVLAMLPKWRAQMNSSYGYDFKKLFDLEKKEGRRLSAASKSKIEECMKQLQTLLEDEADDGEKGSAPIETKSTSTPGAAAVQPEPEQFDHSKLIPQIDSLKGLLQWN